MERDGRSPYSKINLQMLIGIFNDFNIFKCKMYSEVAPDILNIIFKIWEGSGNRNCGALDEVCGSGSEDQGYGGGKTETI